MSNLNKFINRKIIEKLLREQEDNTNDGSNIDMSDYTSLGFVNVGSNPKAIKMKDPTAENNKKIFKNSKIVLPENIKGDYFVLKDYFKELTKTNKLGDSKKELGLSSKIEGTIGDDGTFTYRKLNDNEYQIVSGPIPDKIGKTFKIKYDFTDEQLSKLPKDLNQEKGNMFRGWVNDNKTKDEVKEAFKELPSTDKTLGKAGSFTNDHFKLAYITFKDEYDKHLKRFDTDNAPAFMGLKKAETGKGINNDYYKFVIDDVAVAIDTEGNILQRPRGGKMKDGKPVSTSYVAENKRIRRARTRRLNERKLDVSYIVGKIQKGIESGNIKGMKEIPQGLKDIIKKKAGTVKPKSKSGQEINVPKSPGMNSKSDPKMVNKAVSGLKAKISKAGGGKFVSDQNLKSASQYEDASKEIQVFIKGGEGFRSKVYDDKGGGTINSYEESIGYPTIGIGHLIRSKEREKFREYLGSGSKEMSLQQALELFRSDVAKHTRVFKSQLKAPITHNMFVALASYCFNGGPGALNKFKNNKGESITQLINQRRYKEAADVIDAKPRTSGGKYVSGLEKRRHEEAKLFLLGFKGESGEQKQQNKSSGQNLPYVYIADSQGYSGLGRAIKKRLGPATAGVNFFQKNGATAKRLMSLYGDEINNAVANTKNIILTLGGNGSSMASFLARDILQNAPEDAKITWILAPPPVEPYGGSSNFVNVPGNEDRQVNNYKAKRAKFNSDIKAGTEAVETKLGMSGRINFIDPYAWFEENVNGSKDGVHVDPGPGEEYVATIESELQPNQSSENLSENKTRRNKMIITEERLRSVIKKILLEATEKFEDNIKDRASGNEFRAWVNKNHADIAQKIDLDSSGSHTNKYIKDAWDQLGDEYVKDKEASDQKKKNLSTDGKLKFLKGSNPDGTYPAKPDRGLTKPYLKFVKDEQVFALDPNESDPKKALKQAERGTGKEFVSENQKALFERVLKKSIVENYVNPAKVYTDLKRGHVDDPAGVFAKNKEKIVKIAAAGVAKSKTGSSKSVDPKEHTFIDEDNLPIRFKQIDMSSGAAEAEKILSSIRGTSHKTAAGAKKIVNLVLKPAVERFGKTSSALYYGGKGVSLSDAWKYIGTSETGKQRTAWSGHTLNSFITPGHPFFDENKSLGTLGISYFWPWMIEKRKEVESDPESYIGQKIMMPFSKEEIDSRSDIEIKDGVFSLNGRGGVPKGTGLKGFKAKSKKGAVSGAHMNVYSGGKLIGGNMSGTVKAISPKDGFHTIYFIMVQILPNKKENLA
jgi:GH24 family phage-related lysozyme (muramidase)